MLDDKTAVTALIKCVAPRGAVERTLSYHFAFAQAVDNLVAATGDSRQRVESSLKQWLAEHTGGMVSAQAIRKSLFGPLPIIRYAWLPADVWESLRVAL